MRMGKSILLLAIALILIAPACASAQDTGTAPYTVIYFHGIGCSHCHLIDPAIFSGWLGNYTNLVVIDYEVFQDEENRKAFMEFNTRYQIGTGVPVLFFSPGKHLVGDRDILDASPAVFSICENNGTYCKENTLLFDTLNPASLSGHPRLWHQDRVLILSGDSGGDEALLRKLLLRNTVEEALAGVSYQEVDPVPVTLPTITRTFQHAVRGDTWTLQWNESVLANPHPEGTPAGSAAQQAPLIWAPVVSVLAILFLMRRQGK
jgi:hypothetical protein